MTNSDNATAGWGGDAVLRLRPMSEAPTDGTEIFALFRNADAYGCGIPGSPDHGNFHPLIYKDYKWIEGFRPHWGMRWHEDFKPSLSSYEGWVLPADISAILRTQASTTRLPSAGDGVRSFDTAGTVLTRSCNVLTITCADANTANRVVDQLRTPSLSAPSRIDHDGGIRGAIALEIWHRFADSGTEEWSDETHKAEYLLCADAILALTKGAETGAVQTSQLLAGKGEL